MCLAEMIRNGRARKTGNHHSDKIIDLSSGVIGLTFLYINDNLFNDKKHVLPSDVVHILSFPVKVRRVIFYSLG